MECPKKFTATNTIAQLIIRNVFTLLYLSMSVIGSSRVNIAASQTSEHLISRMCLFSICFYQLYVSLLLLLANRNRVARIVFFFILFAQSINASNWEIDWLKWRTISFGVSCKWLMHSLIRLPFESKCCCLECCCSNWLMLRFLLKFDYCRTDGVETVRCLLCCCWRCYCCYSLAWDSIHLNFSMNYYLNSFDSADSGYFFYNSKVSCGNCQS